jgi:hypothetical protein
MTDEQFLRGAFVSVEVTADFTEAVVAMTDGTRLDFRHTVVERWVKAAGPAGAAAAPGLAGAVLGKIAFFRLNGKHLEIHFADGSRWEARFTGSAPRP